MINASGKNMSPANIEPTLKSASSLVESVVAIGDGRPFNIALIVLDPMRPGRWPPMGTRTTRLRRSPTTSGSGPRSLQESNGRTRS